MEISKIREGFDQLVNNLGKVKNDSTTKFSFTYTGPVPIFGIEPGCGCTNVKQHQGVIEGEYSSGKWNEESLPQQFNKTITVYFNDGNDLYKVSSDGVVSKNSDKLKVVLSITGEIVP